MPDTFAQYLDKWLKQSTSQGLTNPFVKMPVKRFRLLEPSEFDSIANGGSLVLGTLADPIARNLLRNFQTRIRERGEHCGFVCCGAVEITIAGGVGQAPRAALFPVCVKRASLQSSGDRIKVAVSDDETWQFNPVLETHLAALGIRLTPGLSESPQRAIEWVKAQLGNRASSVKLDSYVGLLSSQQLVVQQRLGDPVLRQALARNPVVQAKVAGERVGAVELGETTDDDIEELGLVLPCDDSQLRVVQLTDGGCCLQVEGPPGTGKSQTIANIISNALFHGRRVLLVCDKKAAIVQVEERLTNCGLKPALLNLHDEDLDKREFLRQATDKLPSEGFGAGRVPPTQAFEQSRETRKALNDRVRFGRAIAHPSLQVTRRAAVAGMIQLRKELKQVPTVAVENWQSLSRERLGKLLRSLAEWPGLAAVISNSGNIWNTVRPEAFDNNPNAANELQDLVQTILTQLQSIDDVRALAASVGLELPMQSDQQIGDALTLAQVIVKRPNCHSRLLGTRDLTLAELATLESLWERRNSLIAARHPVPLDRNYSVEAERAAKELVDRESVTSWEDLSRRAVYHAERRAEIERSQERYLRLCDQLGLVYSPLLKTRRAQLQAVLGLGTFGGLIPRVWWDPFTKPVLLVDGWLGKLRACITHAATAPLPLHFVALERVSSTHWRHVEAMAERGFNAITYLVKFVDDRKCKYALQQVYPSIPVRGFKQWREVTLHAVAAHGVAKSVRAAAETHAVLKHLTENYLSVAHEARDTANQFLNHEDVGRLQNAAALVEQWRQRNDLFEVASVHWQTFWESPNPNVLAQVQSLLSEFDAITLPDARSDDLEAALKIFDEARRRIEQFLEAHETRDGDRSQAVVAGFAAQREYARCEERLLPLARYLELQSNAGQVPEWQWLREAIGWRDLFVQLRGDQKLDIDSTMWPQLRERFDDHRVLMAGAYEMLRDMFDAPVWGVVEYRALWGHLTEILEDLPKQQLWLEKKRWQKKIPAFPELAGLWAKALQGDVQPAHAERLFCFNLLRLCDPLTKPQGPELDQMLRSFAEQDHNLASWVLEHLKLRLRKAMSDAAASASQGESELRRLSGLQRIRGTVRELLNAHVDYLRAAKPCWMASPTSLANLVDSNVFEKFGVPFDMVIFDEASQIRVLDGLLSMAFARQVVIVGDKNQLPPTDFFASFGNPDAELEIQDFGLSESLLDEFSGVFADDKTHVTLMSHYRSETPDLIRFSNDWFYGGRLEMYPPAHVSGIGRRFHYVQDAVYSEVAGQRNNPVEAREILKLIEIHVRECPEKSLGVVTMNIPQMELIDSLLVTALPEVQAFCREETRFFLRNLETVQGDEMDRIILSLTYGKNASGQFNAAVLGPLTKSGGDRRLNVAITRSRNGMTIVSSLKAADLESSSAQSRGFACLKALLRDLESVEPVGTFGIGSRRFGRNTDGVSNVIYCDSPFEEQVVEFLENEGYEIECQYGAERFWLDIVVKERGRNLLAIECDGATYHNSLTARTRDRARQRILEEKGWRFHRVWSTNWWFFEQQEKEAIIAAITAARQSRSRKTT